MIFEILAKNGFNFHHAREGFVMMVRWLPTHQTCNIPEYSHTMVGVGGLVINDKNQVLSITEKQPIIAGSWKLPGGYAEPGENLVDAVIREVKEEIGIDTTFVSLVTVRHGHGFNFGCSDLYFVMALKPVNDDIVHCPREIADSKWMDFDEYLNHPNVHDMNRSFLRAYLSYLRQGITIDCKEFDHVVLRRKVHIFTINSPEVDNLFYKNGNL